MAMDRFSPISSRAQVKREPRTAWGRFWARVGLFWERYHRLVLMLVYLLILVLVPLYLFKVFKQSYYYENQQFKISIPPPRKSGVVYLGEQELQDIEIHGNSLLRREVLEGYIKEAIYQIYLEKGRRMTYDKPVEISGFELVQSDFVDKLKRYLTSVRDVRMVFDTARRKVVLTIEERQPILRLSVSPGLVADIDGVVFPPAISTEDHPRMVLRAEDMEIEPGNSLPSCYQCVLHLIDANRRALEHERLPSGIRQVCFRGEEAEDGLLIDLYDGRRIVMLWENMETETVESPKMLELLRDLNRVLSPKESQDFKFFTAIYGEKKQISAKMPEQN